MKAVRIALVSVAFVALPAGGALAQDVTAVFERLRTVYDALDGVSADFTHTLSSSFWDGEETMRGHIVVVGDNYRIETDQEVILGLGMETYVYRPDQNQVIISESTEGEAAFTPTTLLVDYAEHYDVVGMDSDMHQGVSHMRLRLVPKDMDSSVKDLTIWLRMGDIMVSRLVVIDTNETRMDFVFDNIIVNPLVEPEAFIFSPPEGVEVIDLRS